MAGKIDGNSGVRNTSFETNNQPVAAKAKTETSAFSQTLNNQISSPTGFQERVGTDAKVLQAKLESAAPPNTKFDYNQIQGVKNNPNVTPEFIKGVEAMAGRLGAKPEHILAAMSFETGGTFDPKITNSIGATGLIQFLPSTAKELGTTTDKLRNMSSVEQLKYVEKYLEQHKNGKKLDSLEAVYTSILSGSPKSPDSVLFTKGTKAYDQNPLDWNKDGKITAREATAIVGARMFGGVEAVQKKLIELGFVAKDKEKGFADGSWGTNTTNAIADFQKSRGLPQTGLMDEATGFGLFGGAPSVPGGQTPTTGNTEESGGAGGTTNPGDVSLERGSKGESVKALQDTLVKLGHLSQEQVGTGYGTFGPKTEGAVEDFQKKNNLPVTGKFDAATKDAMHEIISGVGRTNQNSPIVRSLQDELVKRGYMTKSEIGNGYGTFGPKTENALKRFQFDNKIQQTGVLGAMTYKALQTSTNVKPQIPTTPTNPTTPTTPTNPTTPSTTGKPSVSRGFTEFTDGPGNHYNVNVSGVGNLTITEGFLVNGPHSAKNGVTAILGNGKEYKVPNGSKVNLGIDYVVNEPGNKVKNWFGGTVSDTIRSDSGYGNRVIIKTDQTFNYKGKDYPVYAHYAHLDSIAVNKGEKIGVGNSVGVMGNTGGSHGAHVDFRTWIDTPSGRIDISPNLLVNKR
jgi:peptidoglycan hydrolase-like protein with peptidoglycan-binding domain